MAISRSPECSICLNDFQDAHQVNCPPKHKFCRVCVVELFQTFQNQEGPCPLCRDRITSYEPCEKIQRVIKSIAPKLEVPSGKILESPYGRYGGKAG